MPWHQDTALPVAVDEPDPALADWGPWSRKDAIYYAHAPAVALESIVALRLHLDDSNERNGPLRVLPESHRLGVLSDDAVAEYAHQREDVTCLVPRGGILLMRPLLILSSAKLHSRQPRRVLHLEYASQLHLTAGVTLAVA